MTIGVTQDCSTGKSGGILAWNLLAYFSRYKRLFVKSITFGDPGEAGGCWAGDERLGGADKRQRGCDRNHKRERR